MAAVTEPQTSLTHRKIARKPVFLMLASVARYAMNLLFSYFCFLPLLYDCSCLTYTNVIESVLRK
jgi:hypothetical protein